MKIRWMGHLKYLRGKEKNTRVLLGYVKERDS